MLSLCILSRTLHFLLLSVVARQSFLGKSFSIPRQMADYLQMAQPSYIRYENGSAEPSLENLVKIADYFDVSVDYLLGRAEY